MWRTIVIAAALLTASGCRNRPTQLDPFLGRTTVPPPPTGSVGVGNTTTPSLIAPPSGSVYTPPGGFASNNSQPGTSAAPPSFTNPSSTPARFTGSSGSTPSSGVGSSTSQQIKVVEPPPGSRSTSGAPTSSHGNLYTGASSGGVDIMDLPVSSRSAQPKTADGGRGVQQNYVSGGATAGVDTSAARTVTLPGQEPAYGFDAAYSQLNGRLEYSPADGRWMLRYIMPGERTDRLGGMVVMNPASPVNGFRNGDMVTVRGRMENDGGGQFMPIYAATTVAPQRGQTR